MKDFIMATRGTTPEEKALIEEIQADIEKMKNRGNRVERKIQQLYTMLEGAGEAEFAAAAFRCKAAFSLANGQVEVAHSTCTDALLGCFDDGGPIVLGGGGRGG